MPKLSDYAKRAVTSSMTIGSGPDALRITYRPSVVTPRFQKAMVQALTSNDLDAGLLWPLSELIVSWNLTDDNDQAIATTPDGLADVPTSDLLAIFRAIADNMVPNQLSAAVSSNGSSPMDVSAPAQSGIQP